MVQSLEQHRRGPNTAQLSPSSGPALVQGAASDIRSFRERHAGLRLRGHQSVTA